MDKIYVNFMNLNLTYAELHDIMIVVHEMDIHHMKNTITLSGCDIIYFCGDFFYQLGSFLVSYYTRILKSLVL